jgi:hypothetical protein
MARRHAWGCVGEIVEAVVKVGASAKIITIRRGSEAHDLVRVTGSALEMPAQSRRPLPGPVLKAAQLMAIRRGWS